LQTYETAPSVTGPSDYMDTVANYYRRIREVDIGVIAQEILGDRITTGRFEARLDCDCPNHSSQSRRSLHIDLRKQCWYCFGCRKGGDVLQLVEFVKFGVVTAGISGTMPETHRKARAFLARKSGLKDLPSMGLADDQVMDIEDEHLSHMHVLDTLWWIADYYHWRLTNRPDVLKWLMGNYGLSEETISDLKIGFAANGPWKDADACPQPDVMEYLMGGCNLFNPEDLIVTGAFIPTKTGRLMPFFKNRIVFPYWHRGNVVFMIARKTPWTETNDYEQGKYKKLRTYDREKRPDIHPCIRNDYLYNEDCLLVRPKRVIITEGVTDCISLMQHSFPVISPVTVRIKDRDRGRLSKRLKSTGTVYVCQDNELSEVGLAAALETTERLRQEGIDTRIVTLPLLDKQVQARNRLVNEFGIDLGTDIRSQMSEKPEDQAAKIEQLVLDAKIDVNEYFASGKTAEDFERLLESAQTPLEYAISALPADADEAERNRALESVLRALLSETPLERKRYLHMLKKRFASVSIEALEAQIRHLEKEAEDHKVKRHQHFPAIWSSADADSCRAVVENTLILTSMGKGAGDYRAAGEAVFEWLKAHGARFFRTHSCEPYMFYRDNVYWMDSPDRSRRRNYLSWLYQETGLVQVQQGGKVFAEVLANLAIRDGAPRDPYTWIHSDLAHYTVYFSLNNARNEIAVISPEGVRVVKNGGNDHDVLLAGSPKMKAVNYAEDVDIDEADRLLAGLIADNLTCEPRLRPFLMAWVMCFLLVDFAGTKPMTRFEGGSQSGKTTASKFLTTLIYGEHQQKKSTIAANYSDGAQNPLVCLDNIETVHMSDELMMFFVTSVTGVSNEKRKQGSDTETVIERTKCLINTSGIEPLYGHLEEIVSRMFAVRFDPSFSTCDVFLEAEAMAKVVANRDLLLSAIMKKTSIVLRLLSRGAHKHTMKLLGSTLGDHGKRRCNDYLAIMYLMMIADPDEQKTNAVLTELSPAFIEQVNLMNESAGDTSRESNQIVNALSTLFTAYSKALEADAMGYDAPGGKSNRMVFEEKYLVEFDSDGCLRNVLARELFSALSKISRDHCLSFGYRSVQQFALRFANELATIAEAGFEVSINQMAHRMRGYDIRKTEQAEVK